MNSGVPWQVKGVRREVVDTALEAARRSGMSVAEWLDTVIVESAREAGVEPVQPADSRGGDPQDRYEGRERHYSDFDEPPRRPSQGPFSEVSARLDHLASQIDQLNQTTTAHAQAHAQTSLQPRQPQPIDSTQQIAEALTRLDRRLDRLTTDGQSATVEIERRVNAIDRAVAKLDREPRRPTMAAPVTPIDHALIEIEARQRALDGEAPSLLVSTLLVPPPKACRASKTSYARSAAGSIPCGPASTMLWRRCATTSPRSG